MKRCRKCDDRGMIQVDGGAYSCACGKHSGLMEASFESTSFESLLAYALTRIQEKGSR